MKANKNAPHLSLRCTSISTHSKNETLLIKKRENTDSRRKQNKTTQPVFALSTLLTTASTHSLHPLSFSSALLRSIARNILVSCLIVRALERAGLAATRLGIRDEENTREAAGAMIGKVKHLQEDLRADRAKQKHLFPCSAFVLFLHKGSHRFGLDDLLDSRRLLRRGGLTAFGLPFDKLSFLTALSQTYNSFI